MHEVTFQFHWMWFIGVVCLSGLCALLWYRLARRGLVRKGQKAADASGLCAIRVPSGKPKRSNAVVVGKLRRKAWRQYARQYAAILPIALVYGAVFALAEFFLPFLTTNDGWIQRFVAFFPRTAVSPLTVTGMCAVGWMTWKGMRPSLGLLVQSFHATRQLVNAWIYGAMEFVGYLALSFIATQTIKGIIVLTLVFDWLVCLFVVIGLALALLCIWIIARNAFVPYGILAHQQDSMKRIFSAAWNISKGKVWHIVGIYLVTEFVFSFIASSIGQIIALSSTIDGRLTIGIVQMIGRVLIYPYCIVVRSALMDRILQGYSW